jgi:hypothetical protein
MKKNDRLGAALTLLMGLLGVIGTFLIFMNWYGAAQHAEAAEPGCEILLKYMMPALSDLGILAGVMYLVSAYGFGTRRDWAFPLAVIANVLALQGAWFINVPFMAADLPPVYFIVFWPNLIAYLLLLLVVGKVPWQRTVLGLLAGMTFVFTLMNGVASWSRILTIGTTLFVAVQRLHWISMIGWGVVTVGLILKPREWMRVVGLTAAVIELVVGIPLAYATAIELGRFSLFSLAPIFSLILLVIFLWPKAWSSLSLIQEPSG